MICTGITLYFAKEIPLQRTIFSCSDSSLLLEDGQGQSQSSASEPQVDKNGFKLLSQLSDCDQTSRSWPDYPESTSGFGSSSIIVDLVVGIKNLSSEMKRVLFVMALTWVKSSSPPLLSSPKWVLFVIFPPICGLFLS